MDKIRDLFGYDRKVGNFICFGGSCDNICNKVIDKLSGCDFKSVLVTVYSLVKLEIDDCNLILSMLNDEFGSKVKIVDFKVVDIDDKIMFSVEVVYD